MVKQDPLIRVDNLGVTLEGRKIIERVSFELFPQEVLAVIGPNGSGKSVLLKALLGFFKLSHGEVIWKPGIQIGYLPQRFHVDAYLPITVKEFLGLKPNAEYGIHEIARLVKLKEKGLDMTLAHLSGGELQKVLLAWALMDKPEILLFDEPTENVDVVGQESIYHLLHQLQDTVHIAVIIVSHDLHVVYRYANHVLCLNKEMVCYGEPEFALTTETLSKLYGDHAFFHHHHYGAGEENESVKKS